MSLKRMMDGDVVEIAGGSVHNLSELYDVAISSPRTDQLLAYDYSARKWHNAENNYIEWGEHSDYVGKNLLKNTGVTQTINNVTFTIGVDGRITVNGTATDECVYIITRGDNGIESRNIDPNTSYVVSGCPSTGGGNDSFFIYEGVSDSKDTGEGLTITNSSSYNLSIYVRANTVMSNVVFSPMLREATIHDAEYEPYLLSNKELVSWKAMGMLGAKNLFNNELETKTESGITYTVNDDKSVSINIEARPAEATGTILGWIDVKEGVTYKLSGGLDANARIDLRNDNYSTWRNNNEDKEVMSPVTSSSIDTFIPNAPAHLMVYLRIGTSGDTGDVGNVYPMIRLAEDVDETYYPYVSSNKELDKKLQDVYGNLPVNPTDTSNLNIWIETDEG